MIERRVLKEKEKKRELKKKKGGRGHGKSVRGGRGVDSAFTLKKKVTFFKVKSLFSLK